MYETLHSIPEPKGIKKWSFSGILVALFSLKADHSWVLCVFLLFGFYLSLN